LEEESGVKCDRLAQHVLATEGHPVPSATMEDFPPPLLPSPVPSSVAHRLIPLRSSSQPVGHSRAIASPSALVSPRLASPSPARQVTCLTTRSYRNAENRRGNRGTFVVRNGHRRNPDCLDTRCQRWFFKAKLDRGREKKTRRLYRLFRAETRASRLTRIYPSRENK